MSGPYLLFSSWFALSRMLLAAASEVQSRSPKRGHSGSAHKLVNVPTLYLHFYIKFLINILLAYDLPLPLSIYLSFAIMYIQRLVNQDKEITRLQSIITIQCCKPFMFKFKNIV